MQGQARRVRRRKLDDGAHSTALTETAERGRRGQVKAKQQRLSIRGQQRAAAGRHASQQDEHRPSAIL